jgi:hypothetical protein
MRFTPNNVEVFMGGKFEIPDQIKTVGQLRKWLKDVGTELAEWGDDQPISEIWMRDNVMNVTLTDGNPQ